MPTIDQYVDIYISYPVPHYWGKNIPIEMSTYTYQWHYLPTNQSGTSTVNVRNLAVLHTLINYWNTKSDDWKYWI